MRDVLVKKGFECFAVFLGTVVLATNYRHVSILEVDLVVVGNGAGMGNPRGYTYTYPRGYGYG